MEFRHTEQHSDNLNVRRIELSEIDQEWQTEARRQVVRHELACLCFEQLMRYGDEHVPDHLIESMNDISPRAQLELEVEASWEARNE